MKRIRREQTRKNAYAGGQRKFNKVKENAPAETIWSIRRNIENGRTSGDVKTRKK